MGDKIREAQTQKVPYQIVIGDSEVEENKLSVRKYGEKKTVSFERAEFLENLLEEATKK